MGKDDLEKKVINHYLKDDAPKIITEDSIKNELEEKFKLEQEKFIKNSRVELKIKNSSNNQDPEYQKIGDSGFDLRADLPTGHIHLEPLDRYVVPTGLFFEIPKSYEVQIRPRSGLAAKQGITVLNTPGTIDSNYRGEIKIILVNLSNKTITINHGDRIAQAVLAPVMVKEMVNINIVKKINIDTDRSDNGFGSTGVK